MQVLVSLAGHLRWASDPLPGSTHDAKAITASGLLKEIDPSSCIADKGPHRNRGHHPLQETSQQ